MMKRIAIHSVPRSGSTWLGSIFDSHPRVAYRYQPLFSYAFKGRLTPQSSKADILSFFQELKASDDNFITQQEDKNKGIVPQFEKEAAEAIVYKEVRYHHILGNLLNKDDELKVIGLVRNPLSTLHSWLNAPKEFRPELGWKIEEEWRFAQKKNENKPEEFNGYEKWKEAALVFEQLKSTYPDRFYLLHYQQLLTDTERTVQQLFDFAGLDYCEQTQKFLRASREVDVADAYGVFKTKVTDRAWEKDLDTSIVDYITRDLENTPLSKYLD
jgi:hypothetical protein